MRSRAVSVFVTAGVLLAAAACTSSGPAGMGSSSSPSTSGDAAASAQLALPRHKQVRRPAAKTPPEPRASAAPKPRSSAPPKHGTALVLAASLQVKGRAPKSGYARAEFGSAWTDNNTDPDGHNGCDTRNDILRRDLTALVYKGSGCAIARGTLRDPYTGRAVHFVRGVGTSDAVQIDHMVALSDAWQTGAQQLSTTARVNLANDPLNLVASDGPTNASKGDGDTATWLPPNKRYRCIYVAHQVAVKAKYRLWTTRAEHAAMVRVLAGCPAMVVPVEYVAPLPAAHSGHTTTRRTPAKAPAARPVHPKVPTSAPTDAPVGAGAVHPGAFCAPAGARGVSSSGRSEICSTTANSPTRARWHSG